MNTYEMKTSDNEVTIYRIGEDGQFKVKEKIAKIDLKTGELLPIGRTKIAGDGSLKKSASESNFPTKTVILMLILLAAAIGAFAFYRAAMQEYQTDFYFSLGFASLTAVVVSIVFYISWLTKKVVPEAAVPDTVVQDTVDELPDKFDGSPYKFEGSDSIDDLQPQNFSEPYKKVCEDEEDVQKMVITSEKDSYFLLIGGEVKGPFTYDQIKNSEIPNNIQVTTNNLDDWFPASQFELLLGIGFEPEYPGKPVNKEDYRIDDDGSVKCVNR